MFSTNVIQMKLIIFNFLLCINIYSIWVCHKCYIIRSCPKSDGYFKMDLLVRKIDIFFFNKYINFIYHQSIQIHNHMQMIRRMSKLTSCSHLSIIKNIKNQTLVWGAGKLSLSKICTKEDEGCTSRPKLCIP